MSAEQRQKGNNSGQGENEAIAHLKEAIAAGRPWHIALLEAVALWTLPEETYNGRCYRYLIAEEAFDWLLLAERMCQEINGLVAEEELADLLFHSKLPAELSKEEFKALIGGTKYRAYLNYLYGVAVEQALQLAVRQEIYKERQAHIFSRSGPDFEDSYERIYGASEQAMLRQFRREKGYPQRASISLSELTEFTYWLFKYRLRTCDRARVASDTRKALAYLGRQLEAKGMLADTEAPGTEC